jgi:catechol 2,3-dioxygenase-like lactoylglutathione lyase family enzyme
MFDHIGLKVKDIAASSRFYAAALQPLGFVPGPADATSASFGPPGAPAFWLSQGSGQRGVHIAFSSASRGAVEAFYGNGRAAGGQDNGPPGLRPDYGATYFAAFLTDPDGNNVEAVCHKEPS